MNGELQRVQHLLELSRYGQAESQLRSLITDDPSNPTALRLLAESLSGQHRDDEAISVARSAVAAAPDDAQTHMTLSDVYSEAKDPVNAIAAARTALGLAPHSWLPAYALARNLRLGTWDERHEALEHAERAVRLAPHISGVHNVHALCLDGLGQREAARAAYQRALELNPNNALAMNNLGVQNLVRGRWMTAGRQLTAALANDPHTGQLHQNFDLLLLLGFRRFWWLLLAIGAVLLWLASSLAPWWLRATVGTLALVAVGLVLRRVLAALPSATLTLARGLWGRTKLSGRLLLIIWGVALCVDLWLTFAPIDALRPAMAIETVLLRSLVYASIAGGIRAAAQWTKSSAK